MMGPKQPSQDRAHHRETSNSNSSKASRINSTCRWDNRASKDSRRASTSVHLLKISNAVSSSQDNRAHLSSSQEVNSRGLQDLGRKGTRCSR